MALYLGRDKISQNFNLVILNDKKNKTTVSGNPIVVTDVSSIEHNLEVKTSLEKKNLIQFEELKADTFTQNGLTFTRQTDGSFLVNGTAGADGTDIFYLTNNEITFKTDTNYMISGFDDLFDKNWFIDTDRGITLSGDGELYFWGDYIDENGEIAYYPNEVKTVGSLRGFIEVGKVFENVRFAPQVELGEVATAFQDPFIDITDVTVIRYGKNLCNLDNSLEDATNKSLSKTEDNKYRLTRVSGSTGIYSGWCDTYIPKNNAFTISFDISKNLLSKGQIYFQYAKADKTVISYTPIGITLSSASKTITVAEDIYYFRLYMVVGEILDSYLEFSNFQLEINSTATEYEPYIEPQTATANFDGTVEGLTSIAPNMTLLTDTVGATINLTYFRDPELTLENQMIEIAMSGGE